MQRVGKKWEKKQKNSFSSQVEGISVVIEVMHMYCNLILNRTPVDFYFQMRKKKISSVVRVTETEADCDMSIGSRESWCQHERVNDMQLKRYGRLTCVSHRSAPRPEAE